MARLKNKPQIHDDEYRKNAGYGREITKQNKKRLKSFLKDCSENGEVRRKNECLLFENMSFSHTKKTFHTKIGRNHTEFEIHIFNL